MGFFVRSTQADQMLNRTSNGHNTHYQVSLPGVEPRSGFPAAGALFRLLGRKHHRREKLHNTPCDLEQTGFDAATLHEDRVCVNITQT